MVRWSLCYAAIGILQERRRKRRRSRGRAMHDPNKRVAPDIILEKEEEELENKRLRRTMQDSNTWIARHIALELLIEILARLPAKSVIKFKCVSKFWSSLFSSKYFCNRFLMVSSQPRLYMTLLDRRVYFKSLLLSSAPNTSPSTLELDQDLTIRAMGGYDIRILRGFISFTYYLKARIYNPSTRQLVKLPSIEESDIIAKAEAEGDIYTIQYFMGHDPVNGQYKLLCTITANDKECTITTKRRSEHWVFVLETGGCWKRKNVAKDFHPHVPNTFELNMKGVIYHLGWIDPITYVLVRFDVRSEELTMLQVPRKAGDGLVRRIEKNVSQINYGGKVAVIDMTYLKKTGTVDLWVVEDWMNKEWSRKTLVLKPCQMHLVTDHILIPKGTHLKGKVILVPAFLVSPFYYLCYDLQTNDLKRVEIKGIPNRWFSKPAEIKYVDVDFMHPSESIEYLEI